MADGGNGGWSWEGMEGCSRENIRGWLEEGEDWLDIGGRGWRDGVMRAWRGLGGRGLRATGKMGWRDRT